MLWPNGQDIGLAIDRQFEPYPCTINAVPSWCGLGCRSRLMVEYINSWLFLLQINIHIGDTDMSVVWSCGCWPVAAQPADRFWQNCHRKSRKEPKGCLVRSLVRYLAKDINSDPSSDIFLGMLSNIELDFCLDFQLDFLLNFCSVTRLVSIGV